MIVPSTRSSSSARRAARWAAGLACLAAAAAPTRAALVDGLVEYLPFDNSTADAMGHPTTVIGASPTAKYVQDGRFGAAATFANTNTTSAAPTDWALSLGNLDATYDAGSFTVSAWVRRPSPNNVAIDRAVLGNKNWTSGANTGWVLATTAGKELNFRALPAESRRDRAVGFNTATSWVHVAVVFDRPANAVTTYLNGVDLGSPQTIGTADGNGSFAAGLNTLVGASGNGTYGAVAQLDDVAIWSRALGASEVLALGTASVLPVPEPTAVAAAGVAAVGLLARRRRRRA